MQHSIYYLIISEKIRIDIWKDEYEKRREENNII